VPRADRSVHVSQRHMTVYPLLLAEPPQRRLVPAVRAYGSLPTVVSRLSETKVAQKNGVSGGERAQRFWATTERRSCWLCPPQRWCRKTSNPDSPVLPVTGNTGSASSPQVRRSSPLGRPDRSTAIRLSLSGAACSRSGRRRWRCWPPEPCVCQPSRPASCRRGPAGYATGRSW